mgnify:CR=1 FL=1
MTNREHDEILMQELAGRIDHVLRKMTGEKQGFCLIVFPQDQPGLCNYIGNCPRDDIKKGLTELTQRWDAEDKRLN